MKRQALITASMTGIMGFAAASVQADTLYIGAYGGSSEYAMKESIIPAFQEKHDVDIVYVAGNSTDTLARLQAQAGQQELNVVLLDDGPMYQAINLGFCAPMGGLEALDDVYDIARFPQDNAVGVGVVATGFAYNAEMFERNGWDAPSSWLDLADERFEGKLVVPSVNNTYGLHTLVMAARLNGGGEDNIDPGFEYIQDFVVPNILSFETSAGGMSQLFQNEEIALSVWGSGRAQSLADTGFPVEFAYPEEGAVALMVAGCLVDGSGEDELSRAFMAHLLTPEIQAILAETQGWGPSNRYTELDDELAQQLPYGDRIEQMTTVEWDLINPQRMEWTNRWNRRVER